MLVSLENIGVSFGEFDVLKNVNINIDNGQKIGVVGLNGAGKSTLLKVITGEIDTYDGVLSTAKNLNIGYLKQNSGLDLSLTLYEETRKVFDFLEDIKTKMENINNQMQVSHSEELAHEYSTLQGIFEQHDGYNIEYQIDTVLSGMGFFKKDYDKQILNLSGGEKTRLSLCKLILSKPDLLVLDEPTNHLDFKTIIWLENYLIAYKNAVLVVSHDRYFLDKTVNQIAEVEHHTLFLYKGNYSKYVMLKDEKNKREIIDYTEQQKEMKKLKEYVDKNIVRASTSKMAKSRRKTLEGIEVLEKPKGLAKKAKIEFACVSNPYKDVLIVKDLDIMIEKEQETVKLIDNLNFNIERGDKIAIIGENGRGKSTFLKMVLGLHPMSKGILDKGKNLLIGYYDQEQNTLDNSLTVMEQVALVHKGMTDLEVRNHLAKVLFKGDDIYKRTSELSGGEKSKLAFALLMLTPSNMLILDEPTNHLDLFTREIIEEGLKRYDGTLIFVSHDRYLLSNVATKIIEFTENGATIYANGFNEFNETLINKKEDKNTKSNVVKKEKKENSNYKTKEDKRKEAETRARIKLLESEIEKSESEIENIEKEILDPLIYGDFAVLNEKTTMLGKLKEIVEQYSEELMELWD